MTPLLLRSLIIAPALQALAVYSPGIDTPQARVLLTAIAIQESALKKRYQAGGGPARSWWQIEPRTAIDVLARYNAVRHFCIDIGVTEAVIEDFKYALQYCDAAACAIARGILHLDPQPLPDVGMVNEAWLAYLRCWRPGKPRPETWNKAYEDALAF